MSRTIRHLCIMLKSGAAAVALTAAGAAQAEQADPDSAKPAAAAQPVPGDIIVTAQRRAESINSVGMSIQALPAETLQE